ncbi:unnamed protein product [Thelazia callipaeda]|uniref:G_PROTEIN_RECEP_F1_2 domain-containing protein n=1 Tax=Thelazia callipaeda TaxID=103827 RepID=A0A0N5D3X4_THECL|nr:unnamed protein product [Thelazia callipaeda]
MEEISGNDISNHFGNQTQNEQSIKADVQIQMKCYESDSFQLFQTTETSVAATIFNILVIFCALKLYRRSGDTMHVFIISMTIGDLLLTVFCHPNEFLIRKHEILRQAGLCAITHFCNWLGLAVSGLSLTMLNFDKLIYFQWPLKYDYAMSKKRASILCVFIWSISMTSGRMYFYDIFMVTYCVLPITSSLIVSAYLYQLTREKRRSTIAFGQSHEMKSLVFIFATTAWTSFSLLPYRIFNICRMHFFDWNALDCETQSNMNWLAHVLLYLLFMNPIVNPLITALIYAPYRLTLKRLMFSIPVRNRSLYSCRDNHTNLRCVCNKLFSSNAEHINEISKFNLLRINMKYTQVTQTSRFLRIKY